MAIKKATRKRHKASLQARTPLELYMHHEDKGGNMFICN